MEKQSRIHTKVLIASLAGILVLSVGVSLLMSFTALGNNFSSFRSGLFISASQSIHSDRLYFSAAMANGSNTFFVSLNQAEIERLSVIGDIAAGEMSFVIAQGNLTHSFELSDGNFDKIIGYDLIEIITPGRIEMRLIFSNAENVSFTISWE